MCRVAVISAHGCPLARLGGRETGGMNVYVRELSRAMARQGMEIDVYTRLTDPKLPEVTQFDAHARVIHIQAGEIGQMDKNKVLNHMPEFVCRVRQYAREHGLEYDFVHSHYWLSAWAGGLLASRWDTPHIVTFHTLARLKNRVDIGPSETDERAEIEARVLRTADAIIASSEHERAAMVDLYGADASSIHVTPPGIDLDLFQPVDREAARAHLGLNGDRILLAAGRIDPIKGFDTLLDATALLGQRDHTRLMLIGGSKDDPDLNALAARARELGIGDRVTFVGAVPQKELPTYYSAADVCVVPSRYESFGMVAAEALACGTPVVASKVGGLPSIVRDGENGVLVPWRRPEALAESIETVLDNQTLRRQLAREARHSVSHLSWEQTARRTISLYRSVGLASSPAVVCACHG
jgi:D-inositol-3-phosphate glycosyltransferase